MRIKKYVVLAVTLMVVLSGCAGTGSKKGDDLTKLRNQSDFAGAARLYSDSKGRPSYNKENLQETLEAAKAFHDAGMWAHSFDAFDQAYRLMPWKEDSVDTPQEVLTLVTTTLTNSSLGPYSGKVHEGTLIDYYQALNRLMMGHSETRVEFNRLEVRQANAVVQLGAFSREINEKSRSGISDNSKNGADQSLNGIQDKIQRGVAGVEKANLTDIRNAAGDVMSAVYRATSPLDQDRDVQRIQSHLSDAGNSAASQQGRELIAQLKSEVAGTSAGMRNKVIVLFEDGNGSRFKEFRVDLPLFFVSSKVLYSGIALPEFTAGNPGWGQLLVGDGYQPTAMLTDLNRISGLEFERAYPGIVTKAVVSTVVKTAAQYVANEAIDDSVRRRKLDPLAGALLKIGTAVTQAALTQADLRSWRNLPNSIQLAIVDRPESGYLKFYSTNRELLGEVAVPANSNHLVLVKGASSAAKPVLFVAPLHPTSTVVSN